MGRGVDDRRDLQDQEEGVEKDLEVGSGPGLVRAHLGTGLAVASELHLFPIRVGYKVAVPALDKSGPDFEAVEGYAEH